MLLICALGLWCFTSTAQRGYQIDSLQIKVYSEIEYKGSQPTKIRVVKVFCDYCNAAQEEYLAQKAWRVSYLERYAHHSKAKNGRAKLAHYIRVHKEDFKKIE